METSEFMLGYAIGIIVGEGSFTHHGRNPVLAVKLRACDSSPLLHLKDLFQGKIHGPYTYTYKDGVARSFCCWHLTGVKLREAIPVLKDRLPPSYTRDRFDGWCQKNGF